MSKLVAIRGQFHLKRDPTSGKFLGVGPTVFGEIAPLRGFGTLDLGLDWLRIAKPTAPMLA